jgi:hypothetical protein
VAAMATAPITARTAATLDPRLTTAEENSLALSAFFVTLTRTDLPIRYNKTNVIRNVITVIPKSMAILLYWARNSLRLFGIDCKIDDNITMRYRHYAQK